MTHPGSLPAPMVAAWVMGWIWDPTIVLTFVFPLLLFPTGRSLSPRWRPVVWVAVGVSAVYTVLVALRPTLELPDGRTVANPIGVASVGNVEEITLGAVLDGLLLLSLAAAIVSLVIRFRRSHGTERQQLKWFAYAGALVLLVPLSTFLLPSLGNTPYVVVIALPIAVGIAILRYRLYDIDRLINRTLVYGLLTALLAGVYAGLVLILGQLFGGIGGEPPSWAVAGATLAVAALFQPARRRIQQVVDRRFNRRRYGRRHDRGAVQRSTAGRGRPGHAVGRVAGGGGSDNAADAVLVVASSISGITGEWWRAGRLGTRSGMTPCMPCSFGLLLLVARGWHGR